MKYTCKCCNHFTKNKYNHFKHLESKKHLETLKEWHQTHVDEVVSDIQKEKPEFGLNEPQVSLTLGTNSATSANESKIFQCKYCDQCYKHKSSLSKHIKYSCMKNKTEDLTELVRLLNLQMEQQKSEFQYQLQTQTKQIETQSKQIEKLMGKLEIHGSFNTTVNQHINLLNYNDTDISHLTDTDYKNCVKRVCKCVMGMIEKVHFNPDKPENMNVYISNMKDKYMMVYQNNKWMLTNKDHLDRIYDDKESMIEQWIEENKDPEMKKFFNRYLDLKKDNKTMEMITEEIKLLMFNNKNLIKD